MSNISDKIKIWIINWFIDNSNIREKETRQNLFANYLEDGRIDSFKFIKFITDIEEHFKIAFSNDEFQNRDFATIDGLAKIINLRMNGK